jgi:hypothetical protein
LEKLDKILVEEIQRARTRGVDITNSKFNVILELRDSAKLQQAIKSNNNNNNNNNNIKSVEELKKSFVDNQSSVIAKLNEFQPVENIKPLPFANAIYTTLTIDQIQKIADLADVKTIRLSRSEHVTC